MQFKKLFKISYEDLMKFYNPGLLHLTVAQSYKLIIVEIDVFELTAMLDQTRLPTIIVDYRRIYQAYPNNVQRSNWFLKYPSEIKSI